MSAEGDSAKLDQLGQQLGAVLVQVATVGAKVDGMREDIGRQNAGHADHEARLRVVEAAGLSTISKALAALQEDVEDLKRWRWSTPPVAAGAGATLAAAVAALMKVTGHL